MPVNRLNRRTGKKEWYGKVTVDGKTLTKKCRSKKSAQEWEVLARAEAEASTRCATVSLLALCNAHMDVVQARFSESSYRDKARVFRAAIAHFGATTDVRKIGYRAMEAWVAQVKKSISAITANRYKVHMVAAWNWGVRALGLPEPCPWRVEKFKEESPDKYVPPADDFWRVYDAADQSGRAMLLVFLHLAARRGEVFDLRWEDVDLDRSRVRLWTRKRTGGREYDMMPMSPELHEALAEQRFLTGLGPHVFVWPKTGERYRWKRDWLPKLCKRAGVPVFGYHSIRHLAACLLDESGEPLAYIQAMLRHKSAVTTSRYLHSLRGLKASETVLFRPKGARPGAQIPGEDSQLAATY